MAKLVRKGGIGIKELERRVDELKKLNVFVGWLESAKYDDNTPVASVAVTQEYGSPSKGIPARPFLRTSVQERREDWRTLIRQGAKAIMNGTSTAQQVMDLVGLKVTGDIKEAIKNVTEPALAPSTIAARKAKKADGKKVGNLTKPLVEEAIMLNSVTHVVNYEN